MLLFRATNAVDAGLPVKRGIVAVQPPPPEPKVAVPPSGPKTCKIAGVVVNKFTGEACTSGDVRLDPQPNGGGGSADIHRDGTFEFDDVPYGHHVLAATGRKGGTDMTGRAKIEVNDSEEKFTVEVKP